MKPTGVTLLTVLLLSLAAPTHADKTEMAVRVGDQTTYWSEHRANHWENEHRNWIQRGGYVGLRLPDEQFARYFGSGHAFLLSALPIRRVSGGSQFQVNGYWMRVVDPWPESWPDGWYSHDEVFVAAGDGGYYLFNRYYPKTALALEFITR